MDAPERGGSAPAGGGGARALAHPDSSPADAGVELVPLNPRVRAVWWAQAALTVVQLGLVALAVDLLAPIPLPAGLIPGVVVGVGVVVGGILPPLRYRRWRYAVRPDDLWIRQGVLWVTVTVVPFVRLQFVDTRQGPLDRVFGLSQLIVHTAALGTSARLPGLDAGTAEHLRERLARVEPGDGGL